MSNEYVQKLIDETLIRAQNIYECRSALEQHLLDSVVADLKDITKQIKDIALENYLSTNDSFKELRKIVRKLERYYKGLVVPTINNNISTSVNV